MERFRVLVFPGGTEIGQEVRRALAPCKEVVLFSAGAVSDHAPFAFRRHDFLPRVDEPGWLKELVALVRRHAVTHVLPAHDDVVLALAENAAAIPARAVTSPAATCRVTRSKRKTYDALHGLVPVPHVYEHAEAVDRFPVFLKSDVGQGSQDTHMVADRDALAFLTRDRPRHLILEYLPGREFTIDCFSDRDRGLLFCGGRQRVRTRAGISMATRPTSEFDFAPLAEVIASALELHGAWFFQAKEDARGKLVLLEVAPRVAGGMALNRVRGVNFPLLSLYESERVPVQINPLDADVTMDRALVNRYRHALAFSRVYVDLDDTLILHGRVQLDLVRFLYQCVNEGKRLTLLTRHAADPEATLRRHRLRDLFDEVVHLGRDEPKSAAIDPEGAILIDDSFRERDEVRRRWGVPTFACDAVELLADDRS